MKLNILFLLVGFLFATNLQAQVKEPERCTEEQIPISARSRHIEQVKSYLNTYYRELLFNVGDLMVQDQFIINNMQQGKASYMPEFILQPTSSMQYIEPHQYLLELNKVFSERDMDEIELVVDNISVRKEDFFLPDRVSCYVIATYDLTIKENEQVLLKRRCKAYCLFPNAMVYIEVKLMQVEPVKDIIAYAPQKKEEAKIQVTESKTGTANATESSVTTTSSKYDFVGKFDKSSGIAVIRHKGKYGFVKIDKTVIAEPVYDDVMNNG